MIAARFRRLRPADDLPQVDVAARREWHAGWWAGIAIGFFDGFALAVVLGLLR